MRVILLIIPVEGKRCSNARGRRIVIDGANATGAARVYLVAVENGAHHRNKDEHQLELDGDQRRDGVHASNP